MTSDRDPATTILAAIEMLRAALAELEAERMTASDRDVIAARLDRALESIDVLQAAMPR